MNTTSPQAQPRWRSWAIVGLVIGVISFLLMPLIFEFGDPQLQCGMWIEVTARIVPGALAIWCAWLLRKKTHE